MDIKSLEQTDFDLIYRAFALAFEDYDFKITYDGLKAMLRRRGFDSALSFAAFEGNEIVSLVLNGIGSFNGIRTAYDTGTGTVKAYRGKGLAAAIFEYSIPYLKKAAVKQYLLEVLQHNAKAVSLYKKLGFEVIREFNYFFQKKEEIPCAGESDSGFNIRQTKIDDDKIQAFWDFEPSWQNSSDSVKRASDGFISLGAFDNDILIAYCIFEPHSGDIAQIAVDKRYRRKGAATLMLSEIIKLSKSDTVAIVNTDALCGSMNGFLKSKNIDISGKQFEMLKKL